MTEPTEPTEPPKALPPGAFPPEDVELDGFRLRRPAPADDVALLDAIKTSFAELHPWMPWCTEPVEIGDQRAFIERSAQQWVEQTAFNWFVVDTDDALAGTISIMDRIGPGGVEIGYWLRSDATGRGVMTRAAARVTDIALGLAGVDRVEIHCDAANARSAAIPQRLGYRLDREERREARAPGETGVMQVWITP
jgi:RimJ/RimL family protein N-acetyltransferase